MPNTQLAEIQYWFASIITQPLIHAKTPRSESPRGVALADEAIRYITPGPELAPHQRIQIYNQQYWWRLLNALQTNFPLVTRLFGYLGFNDQIAVPFLSKHPPDHWSLNTIGDKLPGWIQNDYRENDRQIVLQAAELDLAFFSSFLAPDQPLLDTALLSVQGEEALLRHPLSLQKHVHLFRWNCNLFLFREAMLKEEVDYWMEHAFPTLSKGKICSFVLYRNSRNLIAWKEISQEEEVVLRYFQTGCSLETACAHIEKRSKPFQKQISMHLEKWLINWTRLGWLCDS